MSEDKKGAQNKTLSGLVSICVLIKKTEMLIANVGRNRPQLPMSCSSDFFLQTKVKQHRCFSFFAEFSKY